MSKSTTVVVGERGFWALDDAFAVWLAYLVEEIDQQAGDEPWLSWLAADWRVATVVSVDAAPLSPPMRRCRGCCSMTASADAGTRSRAQTWLG